MAGVSVAAFTSTSAITTSAEARPATERTRGHSGMLPKEQSSALYPTVCFAYSKWISTSTGLTSQVPVVYFALRHTEARNHLQSE